MGVMFLFPLGWRRSSVPLMDQAAMEQGMADLMIEKPSAEGAVFAGADEIGGAAFIIGVRIEDADIGHCPGFQLAAINAENIGRIAGQRRQCATDIDLVI